MRLYAESSGVLRWLLGQADAQEAGMLIRDAEVVVASRLTVLEVRRALVHAPRTEAAKIVAVGRMTRYSDGWHMLDLGDEIMRRAGESFPVEPVSSLDAIHLASALVGRGLYPDLAILSTDARVRTNAVALGFPVVP